jgi:hypothetical protein
MREVDGSSFSSLILIFQRLHHVSIELRSRCSSPRKTILFEIGGIDTSVIGKEGQINTRCWRGGVSFIYILYTVGDKTEA